MYTLYFPTPVILKIYVRENQLDIALLHNFKHEYYSMYKEQIQQTSKTSYKTERGALYMEKNKM